MNSITVLANAQGFFFDGNYETLEDAIHRDAYFCLRLTCFRVSCGVKAVRRGNDGAGFILQPAML